MTCHPPRLRGAHYALTLGVVILMVLASFVRADGTPFAARMGDRAPNFVLISMDGSKVELNDFAGRPVLLNFWTTWCDACLDELPWLHRVATDLEGVAHVLFMNLGEPPEVIRPVLDELGVHHGLVTRDPREEDRPWPEGVLPSRTVATRFRGFGVPTSILLDADGRIAARFEGPVAPDALANAWATVGVDGWVP